MGWTPSIVPSSDDTVYLVVDEFFDLHPVWRETEVGKTDLDTVIQDIIDGQYNQPNRIVAFNVSENWAKDVTAEIARDIRRSFDRKDEDVPLFLERFVDAHAGNAKQLSLRLA